MAKRDERSGAGSGGKKASTGAQPKLSAKPGGQFVTVGETLFPLSSPADVVRLARMGELTRIAQGHLLNARSSRSHCLVHVHLTQRTGGKVTHQQLLFVDLAGSERIETTGVQGTGRAQASAINSLLTVLGKVIRALGDHDLHVPYRDSTLTMLLRSSFGGRSCTAVVVNVASDPEHAPETVCSLEFGKRMAVVRPSVTVAVGHDIHDEQASLEAELEQVRAELNQLEAKGLGGRFGSVGAPSEQRAFEQNVVRVAAQEDRIQAARVELAEAGAKPGGRRTPGSSRGCRMPS